MSSGVTQVKKRFAEMSTYLHKDDKGQQLLKLLKDDVNVLRKSLAAADAAKDAAVALMETARQRTDKAETAAASLVESNKRLQDQNNSLQSQVASLTQKLATAEDSEDGSDVAPSVAATSGASRVMKRLWKTLPKCPHSYGLTKNQLTDMSARGCAFRREELTPGWSHQDMWLLGAAVSMISGVLGHCVIIAEDDRVKLVTADGRGIEHLTNPEEVETIPLFRHFLRWFTANVVTHAEVDASHSALVRAAGFQEKLRGPDTQISPKSTAAGLNLGRGDTDKEDEA